MKYLGSYTATEDWIDSEKGRPAYIFNTVIRGTYTCSTDDVFIIKAENNDRQNVDYLVDFMAFGTVNGSSAYGIVMRKRLNGQYSANNMIASADAYVVSGATLKIYKQAISELK